MLTIQEPVSQPPAQSGANEPIRVQAIRLPQAEERKRLFLEVNQIEGVKFVFVNGVDGKELDVEEMARENLILPGTTKYTFSTLGCGLAHRARWLEAIEVGQPLVVCEDDVVFRKDFRQQFRACMNTLPADWDFLLLGYNFNSVLEVEIVPGVERLRGTFARRDLGEFELHRFQETGTPVCALPLRNAFGTAGYAISTAGARHLLANVFPLHNRLVPIPAMNRTIVSFSIDSIMNWLYQDMKAYACVPPLVVSPNKKDPEDREVEAARPLGLRRG